MSEPTDPKYRSNVKEELVKRGFALELETYLALNRRGWISGMQAPYTDAPQMHTDRTLVESLRDVWSASSEPTYRTVDVSSFYDIPTSNPRVQSAQIMLAVECKWRKKEDWVFYTESTMDTPGFRFVIDYLTKIGFPNLEGALSMVSYGETSTLGDMLHDTPKESLKSKLAWQLRAASHQNLARMGRCALSHVSIFEADNIDNITGACGQALGAASYFGATRSHVTDQMLADKKPFFYWRIYPVVVFSRNLWEAKFTPEGELDVEPLKWITYLHMYKGTPHSVDIVSHNHLEDYLDALGSEIDRLKTVLSATD